MRYIINVWFPSPRSYLNSFLNINRKYFCLVRKLSSPIKIIFRAYFAFLAKLRIIKINIKKGGKFEFSIFFGKKICSLRSHIFIFKDREFLRQKLVYYCSLRSQSELQKRSRDNDTDLIFTED